jgi:hypothetical protein
MEKTVIIHPCSFGFSRKGRVCDPHWEFRALANLVRQINVSLVDMKGLILFFPLSSWKPSSLRKVSVILTTTSAKLCHLDEKSYFIGQLVQTSDDDHPSDLPYWLLISPFIFSISFSWFSENHPLKGPYNRHLPACSFFEKETPAQHWFPLPNMFVHFPKDLKCSLFC